MHRLLIIIAAVVALSQSVQAQIEVKLDLARRIYLRGEPVEATVTIRNFAGRDITLRDLPDNHWFSFEVIREDAPVPPHASGYQNPPLSILSGESVSRTVDVLKLYPVNELSTYKVRAVVYFHETGKSYVSAQGRFDISEGRSIYKQTVGVPALLGGSEGEYRTMSLISFQTPKELQIYARVEDEGTGAILCTYPLGRLINGAAPTAEFDNDNTMYAFHMTGPSQYALSKIGVNGEWLGQSMWRSARGRASVRKKEDGRMVVVGASREREAEPGAPPVPKLSDAPPVPIPGQ